MSPRKQFHHHIYRMLLREILIVGLKRMLLTPMKFFKNQKQKSHEKTDCFKYIFHVPVLGMCDV